MPNLGTGPVTETTLIRLLVRLGAEPHSPVSRSDGANGAPAVVALMRCRLHAESPASRVVVSRKACLRLQPRVQSKGSVYLLDASKSRPLAAALCNSAGVVRYARQATGWVS